jgi:hypothetical protein
LRSSVCSVRSGLELPLTIFRAGVCDRGVMLREEAVSARPRVWLGSRREDGEGLSSIWCDTFPAAGRACRRGKAAAPEHTGVSTDLLRADEVRRQEPNMAQQRPVVSDTKPRGECVSRYLAHFGNDSSFTVTEGKILTHAAGSIFCVWRSRLRSVRSGSRHVEF